MTIWVYVLCNFSQKIDIGSNLEIQSMYTVKSQKYRDLYYNSNLNIT